jgi:carbon starvation protein
MYDELGIDRKAESDPLHATNVDSVGHLDVDRANLADIERLVGGESLRGRVGGAVTLAVGMARIFTKAMDNIGLPIQGVMKYWYHFAIMFEALFILTTIDTGTRIARFLLQEAGGKFYAPLEKTDWWPGAVLATFVVTAAWGALVYTASIQTIWTMFGIANQLLAVVALALVTTLLINTGRARYAAVTLLPMLFVSATTLSAAYTMTTRSFPAKIQTGVTGQVVEGTMNLILTVFVVTCVLTLLLFAASRWFVVLRGLVPIRVEPTGRQMTAVLQGVDGTHFSPATPPAGDGIQPAASDIATTEGS